MIKLFTLNLHLKPTLLTVVWVLLDPFEYSLCCPFVTETFRPLRDLVETAVAFDPTGVVANFVALVVPFERHVVEGFAVAAVEGTLVVGFVFADY